MPITGRVKFFERSKNLISDGAKIEASGVSDNNDSIKNLLSFDRNNYFQTSTPSPRVDFVTINFPTVITFDTVIFVDTNFEDVSLTVPTETIARDIDNNDSSGGIAGTSFSLRKKENTKTRYLQLEKPQQVQSINLIFQYFQVNFRYYARQLIFTNEIGTFEGFPTVSAFTESNNEIVNRTSTGLRHITKQIPTIDSFRIRFNAHPIENDVTLSDNLFKSQDSFTLWPCGGGYGSNHFLFEKDGWRLEDIYNVQTVGKKSHRWYKNFYKSGSNTDINLVEVI